jgi:hypothetical protein
MERRASQRFSTLMDDPFGGQSNGKRAARMIASGGACFNDLSHQTNIQPKWRDVGSPMRTNRWRQGRPILFMPSGGLDDDFPRHAPGFP